MVNILKQFNELIAYFDSAKPKEINKNPLKKWESIVKQLNELEKNNTPGFGNKKRINEFSSFIRYMVKNRFSKIIPSI